MKIVNLYEKPAVNWPVMVMLAIAIAGILSGCSTAKELMDKAEKKDPAIVAKYARDKYPCTDLLKPDTAVIWKDTTIFIECPETTKGNDFEVIKYDTIKLPGQIKTVRVPVTMPVRTVYIDRWFEDSAKLKLYAIQVDKGIELIRVVQVENKALLKDLKHSNKENWIWRIIASVLILWQLWKIYRKIMIKI